MEIYRDIPFWAVRSGTYILIQTDNNIFETVSSFDDGKLRLEVKDERTILLKPMFNLPEGESGLTELLVMHKYFSKITDIITDIDEDFFLYYGFR